MCFLLSAPSELTNLTRISPPFALCQVRRYPPVAGTAAAVPSAAGATDTQGEQQQQQQQQHGDAQQPFVRDAAWRVCAEGAQTLAQHMTRRLLRLSDPGAGVFRRLLDGGTIALHELQSACSDGTCDGELSLLPASALNSIRDERDRL